MNFVPYSKKKSLSTQVAELLKGIDLRPGESLEVRRSQSHNAAQLWSSRLGDDQTYGGQVQKVRPYELVIECDNLSMHRRDMLLASSIEKLELYQKSRYKALHDQGVHFIGQLTRMWPIKELCHVKGIGRNTQAMHRITWALLKHGLTFGMWFSCGPRELKKLTKVSARFLIQTSWDAYREGLKRHSINPKLFTELDKEGIHTFVDVIRHPDRVKNCFTRAYYSSLRKRNYSPSQIEDKIEELESFQRLDRYLARYHQSLTSEFETTA
jgi:hypothetical protein